MSKEDYYNAEGYPIPTHYHAMQNIMTEDRKKAEQANAYRPMVYICSPFRGDVENNVKKARMYSRYAVERGYMPVTPHLLFPQFMNDDNEDERRIAIHMGLVLLTKCQELWVFGDNISEGMQREIRKAKCRVNITIRYFTEQPEEKENG